MRRCGTLSFRNACVNFLPAAVGLNAYLCSYDRYGNIFWIVSCNELRNRRSVSVLSGRFSGRLIWLSNRVSSISRGGLIGETSFGFVTSRLSLPVSDASASR